MSALVEYYRARLTPLPVSTYPAWKLVRTRDGLQYLSIDGCYLLPKEMLDAYVAYEDRFAMDRLATLSAPSATCGDDSFDYYDDDEESRTCEACHGDGGDPWNDRITPCEACDGRGTK